MHKRSLRAGLLAGTFTVVGIFAAGPLSRASDALWWQVLPWVLLAGFWAYLLVRHRRRPHGREV